MLRIGLAFLVSKSTPRQERQRSTPQQSASALLSRGLLSGRPHMSGGSDGSVAPQLQDDSSQQQDICNSWLTSLQLVAVQPACLRAHSDTPLQHQQQGPAQVGPLQQLAQQDQHQLLPPHDPQEHLQHHELLLQLQATLAQTCPQAQRQQLSAAGQLEVSAITAGATMASCHLLPLQLQKAVLQVVLLNRQMQVLLHTQFSITELLQQQQQHNLPASSSDRQQADCPSSSSQNISTADAHHSDHADQMLHFNVQLSAPCQPSAHVLDALHLFVTMCPAQLSDPAADSEAEPAACLVAELPLLVMPAQAQQEVQQLLLPAMRQDVQTEQQELLQDESPAAMGAADVAAHAVQVEQAVWQHFNQLALDILLILQLSEAVRGEAAQVGAAASSSLAASQPVSPSAGAAADAATEELQPADQQQLLSSDPVSMSCSSAMDNLIQAVNTLLLPLLLPFLTAHGLHSTLQVLLQCLPPQLQLQQHWQAQQLARLEALAALPQPAAEEQDSPGLPAGVPDTTAAADAVVVSSAMLDTPTASQPAAAGTAAPAAADHALSSKSESVYGSGRSSPPEDWEAWSPEQQQPPWQQQWSISSQAGSSAPVRLAAGDNRGGPEAAEPSGSSRGAAAGNDGGGVGGSSGVRSRAHAASGEAQEAPSNTPVDGRGSGDDGGSDRRGSGRIGGHQFGVLTAATGMPFWLVPFKQFADSETERRYLAWKHQQLLYLDALGGVYTLAIAGALTKPALFGHPATWILLLMTIIKALPHIPLMLGYKEHHLRFRELWMFLASPCVGLVLCFLVLATNAWQPATMPPMPVAYRSFWRMHGELITAALRAFFQHMRLRPFLLYTIVDRVISMQIWAPWSGFMTAVGRSSCAGMVSVVVCWALELCYRRRFVLAGLYRPASESRVPHSRGVLLHGPAGGAGGS